MEKTLNISSNQEEIDEIIEVTPLEAADNLLPPEKNPENQEHLENLRDELEKNYFVLKGLFTSKFSLINGLFEIIANGVTGAIFRIRAAASYYDAITTEIAVDLPWEDFSGLISDKLLNRKIGINSLTHSLNDHLKRLCDQDFNFQVYEFINTSQFKELDSIVRREIRKVIKEEVRLELGYEVIDFNHLNHKPTEEGSDNGKDKPRVKMDDFTIYLHSEPIVDPIKGKTVTELVKGEYVYSYIREKTSAGIHIAEALGGLKNGQLRPVRSTVKRMDSIQNDPYSRIMLEVLFAPGIGARSPISRELKLAVFEPVIIEDEPNDNTKNDSEPVVDNNALEITRQRLSFREKINNQNMIIFSLTMFIGFLLILVIAIQLKYR